MREHKFRGKRIDNWEWVVGNLIIHKDKCYIQPFNNFVAGIVVYDEVDPETVGEFTTINDSAGNEIYSNSIVKCTELRGEKLTEFVSDVFWEDGCYLLHESKDCDVELGAYVDSPTKQPLTEIYVIGNTTDNPELLAGEQS